MIIIPKCYKAEIKAFQKEIAKREKEEEKWFVALCKKMDVHPDSEDGLTLWDHIYNDTDWTVEYSKK